MPEYLVVALGGDEHETGSEIVIVEADTHEHAMALAIVGFFALKFSLRERIIGTHETDILAERFFAPPPGSDDTTSRSPEEFAHEARAFFASFPEFAELYIAATLAMVNDEPTRRPPLTVPDAVLVHVWQQDMGIPLLVTKVTDIPRVSNPTLQIQESADEQ